MSSATTEIRFDDLYDRWFMHVLRWLRAFGTPDSELEDLAQEVFIVAERKLSRFDGRRPAAWLYRIAARTASDFRRRSWFKQLWSRRDFPLETVRDGAATPQELLERKEAQQLVRALLSQLSEKRRVVFALFELEGYSGEEIASMQEIPLATVWTRLHHARADFFAALRKHLGKDVP